MIEKNHITGAKRAGFTFSEVMITMGLFMVLASVGMGAYFKYYQFSLINNDLGKITKILHETRFKALKNPYGSNYGVHISSGANEFVVFRDTYTPSNPENMTVKLERMDITDLNLMPNPGVTNNIVFQKMTGKTQNSGSFKVRKDDFVSTIHINSQGVFEND
jgi:Tfp pilus assembly protein PilE